MDHLGLEQAVDRFGQGVVVGIPYAFDRGLDTGFGQTLGVANTDVLRSSVAMVDKVAASEGPPVVECLLQGVENEVGVRRLRHAPADNPAGERVDDESHINEAAPGGDMSKIADPQGVRPRRLELSVHQVQRTGRGLVADRRLDRFAANDALQAKPFHQPSDRAAGDVDALALHLAPDLANPVDAEVRLENTADVLAEFGVSAFPRRATIRIEVASGMLVIRRWGERKNGFSTGQRNLRASASTIRNY